MVLIKSKEENKKENSFVFINGKKYIVKESKEITNLDKEIIKGKYFIKKIERA